MLEKMYQGADEIVAVNLDLTKKIIIVQLANGKQYYNRLESFEDIKAQIIETAQWGKKLRDPRG